MTTPDTPTLVELANDLDGARYVSMNDGTGDYDLPAAAALEMRLAADRIEYLEARAEKLAGALGHTAEGFGHDLPTRVIAMIARELGVQHVNRVYPDIAPASRLSKDLHVDAIDRQAIACALDEEFGIELPDAAIEGWATVADVIASVVGLVGESV